MERAVTNSDATADAGTKWSREAGVKRRAKTRISRRTFLEAAGAASAMATLGPVSAAHAEPALGSPYATFEQRARHLLGAFATADPNETEVDRAQSNKLGPFYAQARFELGVDREGALRIIEQVLDAPQGAGFTAWALVDTYLRFADQFTPELQERVRSYLTGYVGPSFPGVTENQKAMQAVAAYLTAQTWPDDVPAGTFQAARSYLNDVIDVRNRYGTYEQDSYTYMMFYPATALSLYDLADDTGMKQTALMHVEWMLINIVGQWSNGYYMAPTTRSSHLGEFSGPRVPSPTTTLAWLYFDGPAPDVVVGEYAHGEQGFVVPFAVSPFRIPLLLERVAQSRRTPYVHLERHSGFNLNPNRFNFCVTAYMGQGFGVASQFDDQTGLPNYWLNDQLLRWFVRWESDKPGSTLMFRNPWDGIVGRDDEYYSGMTNYEQVMQHKNVVVAVWDVPEEYRYDYIEGPIETPATLKTIYDDSGWILIHGGSVLIAARPVKPYVLTGTRYIRDNFWRAAGDRFDHKPSIPVQNLHSDGRKNGVIVEAAAPRDFARPGDARYSRSERIALELGRFADAIKSETAVDSSAIDSAHPALHYRSLAGDSLSITFNGEHVVNDKVIDYAEWPLIDNPYMHQDYGSDKLVLQFGGRRRVYDFAAHTIAGRR